MIGFNFQQQTKYDPHKMPVHTLNWDRQPETYKVYKDFPQIDLPKFTPPPAHTLDQLLRHRRSIRDFTDKPLELNDLSFLLWASNGIIRRQWGCEFRTAPSAGALYPMETYLIINNTNDLEQGVYHYALQQHRLEQLVKGDFRTAIAQAALGQGMCASACVVFIWTAVFARSTWKYDQRAYRYIYLDAGHIAQNLALAATALSIGTCQIAALYDDRVNQIINVDGQSESTLYMSVAGHPAPGV